MARIPQHMPAVATPVQVESPIGIAPAEVTSRSFVDASVATSSAVRNSAPGSVPIAKQYRVTRPGFYFEQGHRYTINMGRLVTDAMYDIEELRKQGIELTELPAN